MKAAAWSSLVSGFCLLLLAAEAHASFKVCNYSGTSVFMTMAYKSGGAFRSQGWWEVPGNGACVLTLEDRLRTRYYYLHGQDAAGSFLSGNYRFCVMLDPTFAIEDAEASCSGGNREWRGFVEVDTGDGTDFTYNILDRFRLVPPPPGSA